MTAAEERQNRIVELVSEKGNIQVDRLAQILDVSQMTIRRDLDKLDREGIIERRHGVAVIKHETTYTEKMVTMMEEKRLLAEACAAMVKPVDTVFLDSGTTIYEIAKRIMDIPDLTVITDDIETGFLLHRSGVELMICGGTVQKETGSIFGTFSNQMMSYIHVGIAFMGAMSIDSNFNVLTPTLDKASLKRMVTKNANKSYLVVDHSKFNRQALMKINSLQDYTGVVTTKIFDGRERERIEELKIQVVTVGGEDKQEG